VATITKAGDGSLGRLIDWLDLIMDGLATLFLWAANLCLFLMLLATSVTILGRPLGISFYWVWPWSMVVFVWMSFLGFFAVYRRRKDIAVDFVMQRLGPRAMAASRWFVALTVLVVIGIILMEMPLILESQRGVVDGALLPGGHELNRYALSVPLAVSCLLIFVNALLDLAKAWLGRPEPIADHHVGDE
jgi:TRAP-type C4-dicarboxylate transport system permease small subunit